MTQEGGPAVSYNTCERDNITGSLYNTQAVIAGGVLVAKYHKMHPWPGECFAVPPTNMVTFTLQGTMIGIFTCFDIMFTDPKDDLVKMGVKFFSYSSAIPLIAKTAVEVFSWANRVTVFNSNLQMGQSQIVTNGTTLSQSCPSTDTVCIAFAEV